MVIYSLFNSNVAISKKHPMKFDFNSLKNPYTWEEYLSLHEKLVENKGTTGPVQNEEMAHYTMLNLQRSKRVLKQLKLDTEIVQTISQLPPQKWVLITEPWCGDASQSVPAIASFAKASSNIELKLILRDENLEIMDMFLTNGGRSIPVLIRIQPETNEVISHWGPRPKSAQEIFVQLKKEGKTKEELVLEIQKWYNENKSIELITELIELAH
jgi:hypothetical protein